MLKKMFIICLYVVSFCCFCGNTRTHAYIDKETHPAITKEAAEQSDLNNFLKEFLGISKRNQPRIHQRRACPVDAQAWNKKHSGMVKIWQ